MLAGFLLFRRAALRTAMTRRFRALKLAADIVIGIWLQVTHAKPG